MSDEARRPLSRASVSRAVDYSSLSSVTQTRWATACVAAIHVLALAVLIYKATPDATQQPVLSFTVTMMDISSSPNTVSTAASTSSAPSQKQQPQKTIAQVTPDARAAKVKKIVKSDMVPTPKNNAPLSHSSRAQTAVLAPTTPAQFDSAYLKNPAPSYPPLSRRMGEQGSILLSVFVNEMGQAQDIRLKQSSGYERLDAAALETVKRWRFVAAKQEERLVASWVNVPIKFVLE